MMEIAEGQESWICGIALVMLQNWFFSFLFFLEVQMTFIDLLAGRLEVEDIMFTPHCFDGRLACPALFQPRPS